jgi:hypothetical protein
MDTIGQTRFIRSGPDYGPWQHGPYGVAVHCLQCAGTADVSGLAGPGTYTANEGLSPHTMSDRRQVVEVLGPDRFGAHVGGQGNPMLWGAEVTGFAEWGAEEWMDNAEAVRNQSKAIGLFWAYQGWDVNDLKWGSLAELSQARSRFEQGLGPIAPRIWPHADVSQAIGGTTHWDVGQGYPFAQVQAWAREWAGGGDTDWLATASVEDLVQLMREALEKWLR